MFVTEVKRNGTVLYNERHCRFVKYGENIRLRVKFLVQTAAGYGAIIMFHDLHLIFGQDHATTIDPQCTVPD